MKRRVLNRMRGGVGGQRFRTRLLLDLKQAIPSAKEITDEPHTLRHLDPQFAAV